MLGRTKKKEITAEDVLAWRREGNVKKLRKALASPDLERDAVAADAATALCELGDRESTPQIAELLRSDRLGQFEEGPLLLRFGELAGIDAIPTLIYALQESIHSHVRDSAATALHGLGSETVEPLIRTLETSEKRDSRRWAAQLLGEFRDQRALEPLRVASKAESNAEMGIQSVIKLSLESLEGPG